MSASAPLLELDAVSRYYGPTVALDRVELSVRPGELVFILGGNGAGKSTLLAIAAGVLAPSEGDVRILGEPARRRSAAQRRAVGYSCERAMLYAQLTIEESLGLVAASAPGGKARLPEILDRFGLRAHAARRVRECSQGVLRRAGLARAAILEPSIWILDEPFSHLDVPGQEAVLRLVRGELEKGRAVLLSSHEEALLNELPGRVAFLAKGRILPDVSGVKAALGQLRSEV